MACASDKSFEVITPEHAVLIPPVPAATSILAYVEAVATVIGSCHIHSVYEDQGFIKIYMNDKKFVDFLVNSGISVLGRRVNVDYAIPRADKVTLKNVDPIIPDSILMRFLCFYGTPVSTIIHEKIAANLEYSHIECGTRKIYMNLFKEKKPPTKVSIQYQDVCYRFEVSIERCNRGVVEIDSRSTEEGNEDETVDDAQEVESIESMKPNLQEMIVNGESSKKTRSPTAAETAYRNRGSRKLGNNSMTYAARRIKSRAAKGWYKVAKTNNTDTGNRLSKMIAKKLVASSARGKRRGGGRGGARGRGRGASLKGSFQSSTPLPDSSMKSVEENDATEDETTPLGEVSPVTSVTKRTLNISQYPLTTEELKKLMFQTRCHRAPILVAREFLDRKNIPNALEDLLKQLLEYRDAIKVQSLRIRISRLVKTLRSSMDDQIS